MMFIIRMMSNRMISKTQPSKELILQVIHQVDDTYMEVLSSKNTSMYLGDGQRVELLIMTTTSTH
jgi:hypothetical protein